MLPDCLDPSPQYWQSFPFLHASSSLLVEGGPSKSIDIFEQAACTFYFEKTISKSVMDKHGP